MSASEEPAHIALLSNCIIFDNQWWWTRGWMRIGAAASWIVRIFCDVGTCGYCNSQNSNPMKVYV